MIALTSSNKATKGAADKAVPKVAPVQQPEKTKKTKK